MKRILITAFLIVALLLAGGAAALSVIPHTHGDDVDHSKHHDCPVYQISLAGFFATVCVSVIPILLIEISFLVLPKFFYAGSYEIFFLSLRAPPEPV